MNHREISRTSGLQVWQAFRLIKKKNRRNSTRWKIAHQEWICFHPQGLSESHLCLPLKLEKCSPIFLVPWNKREGGIGMSFWTAKRDVVNFQIFNLSTFRVKHKISLRWSWIVQHPQAPSHVGNTATTVVDVFVESPCFSQVMLAYRVVDWFFPTYAHTKKRSSFGAGFPRY